MRMEDSLPNHHEDHTAGKGDNSLQHYNLVHKFIPMPRAMKIPAAKAAVDKEWEKLEKIPAWDLTKVITKSEVLDEARKRADRCSVPGHPLAGLLWEPKFEGVLLKLGWEKVHNWECLFVHRKQGLFLSVYVDDIKMVGKKQNVAPMWKN